MSTTTAKKTTAKAKLEAEIEEELPIEKAEPQAQEEGEGYPTEEFVEWEWRPNRRNRNEKYWVDYEKCGVCSKCGRAVYRCTSLPYRWDSQLKGGLAVYAAQSKRLYCQNCAPEAEALFEHAGNCTACQAEVYGPRYGVSDDPEEGDRLLGANLVIMVATATKSPPMPYCDRCYTRPTFTPGKGKVRRILDSMSAMAGVRVTPADEDAFNKLLKTDA